MTHDCLAWLRQLFKPRSEDPEAWLLVLDGLGEPEPDDHELKSPQLDDGAWGYTDGPLPGPGAGAPTGRTGAWHLGSQWHELWEFESWSAAASGPFYVWGNPLIPSPAPGWGAARLAALAAAGPGDGRYAHLTFEYMTLPTPAQINALVDPPAGSTELRFEVFNAPNPHMSSPPAIAPRAAGRLWRCRFKKPNDARDWHSDHWVMTPDYRSPTASVATVVTPTTPESLKDMLTAALAAAAGDDEWRYVRVTYPLESYDPGGVS